MLAVPHRPEELAGDQVMAAIAWTVRMGRSFVAGLENPGRRKQRRRASSAGLL
ncbi:hypothetical protein [Paracraurococcus lichenis]|uniref:Transposase n=1 Tax=Paracraurococcus lichenis TaxID=3064888 RepID=A0ABT9EEG9_9PROT|nr:hypothetical protein [Paracraurococcus sp. LOR1-02]MDO9714621.1 hypothetical protein [Paracraurococcus sp. LOR1-02]